jgi:hypothetical protein
MAILARDDATSWEASEGVDDGPPKAAPEQAQVRKRAVNKRPITETVPYGAPPSGHGPGAPPAPEPQGPMSSLASGGNTMDPVWQRLWLRCQQHDWQSLAFIGSSKRDPDGVLEIAHGMARLASELGQELTVFDARNLGLKDMGRMLAQIQSITSRGKRCIVVLKLVTENATTVPMAQNVDAALLGVFIGETSVVASSRTIEEVGRAKFLGSVVLNASLAK